MSEENLNSELSLDDIFSRKKSDDSGEKSLAIPFKFLDSYTKEDKNIFFGRDSETEEIFRKFYNGRLLVVYGKSGTGKSSLINCGLISMIPQEDIFPINIRSGNKAFDNFLSKIKKCSTAEQIDPISILEDIYYEHSKPVMLIFDQFEEAFILSDSEQRGKLAGSLSDILKSKLKINIILIIREEYFADLTEFEFFIPGLLGNRIRIDRMNRSSAKEAIIKPCHACNVGIEEGLADLVIEQLAWQAEGLELTWLQIIMDKLYRIAIKRDPDQPILKLDDLRSLGRIGNVLSDFLDEQLQTMQHGDLGEAMLKGMISSDGTKKQVNLNNISENLKEAGHSPEKKIIEQVLRHLIDVRIITERNELGYYELRHDALAGRIYDRMTATEKEIIEVRSFLDNSYKIYRKRKVLLTENDLKYIALHEKKLVLNNELKDFIKISKKEAQRARRRRRNIAVVLFIVTILVLSVFTFWAVIERTNALEQTKIAEDQKNEALKANREAEKAKLEALNGKNKAEVSEKSALEQKQLADEQRQAALRANREAENSKIQALTEKSKAEENEKLAYSAKLQADSSRNEVIKAGNQARFYLYLFNGKELANKSLIMQENDTLRGLLSLTAFDLAAYGYKRFSPTETSVKYDNEILKALQRSYLSFVPDSLIKGEIWAIDSKSNTIVYSSQPGHIVVARLETKIPQMLPVLTTVSDIELQSQSLVRSLSFDSDSKRIACGTIDGNIIIIDTNSNPIEQQIIYNQNNSRVLSLTFVPGKKWLISASTDKSIHVWDLDQKNTIKVLTVDAPVQKIVLSESDQLIFSDSKGNILVWDLDQLDLEPKILYSYEKQKPFHSLAFNPVHNWLVASSFGEIMLFTLNADRTGILKKENFEVKHKAVVSRIEFSPDNKWIVTAGNDAIMIWNINDSEMGFDKILPLVIETNRQIFSLIFDNESRYILYGDNEMLHIYPIDIQIVYTKLKLLMGKRQLTDREWRFYVKGDLEKPVTN